LRRRDDNGEPIKENFVIRGGEAEPGTLYSESELRDPSRCRSEVYGLIAAASLAAVTARS
jgi:hypothetical protein